MSTAHRIMDFSAYNDYVKNDFTPKFLNLYKKLADRVLELNKVQEIEFDEYSVTNIILSMLFLEYDLFETPGYDDDDCHLFTGNCREIINNDNCIKKLFVAMKKFLKNTIGDIADGLEFSSSNFRNMGDHYKLQFYIVGYDEKLVGYPSEMCIDVYKK